MEEIEPPTEHIHEHLHHAAEHGGERWISWVALTAMILAVTASIAAMLAGHHSHEALISQMQAADQWSYYQSKGLKEIVLTSKTELLAALGHKPVDSDREKLEKYKKDQAEISEKAKEKEKEAEEHFASHIILARGVTLFQVAIAIGGIAALSKRKGFFFASLVFGFGGVLFLLQGLFRR